MCSSTSKGSKEVVKYILEQSNKSNICDLLPTTSHDALFRLRFILLRKNLDKFVTYIYVLVDHFSSIYQSVNQNILGFIPVIAKTYYAWII